LPSLQKGEDFTGILPSLLGLKISESQIGSMNFLMLSFNQKKKGISAPNILSLVSKNVVFFPHSEAK